MVYLIPVVSFLILLPTLAEASVSLERFLPYGPEAGDFTMPPGDDESSEPIRLKIMFPFMDNRETTAWVNINGIISFASRISDYKPTVLL